MGRPRRKTTNYMNKVQSNVNIIQNSVENNDNQSESNTNDILMDLQLRTSNSNSTISTLNTNVLPSSSESIVSNASVNQPSTIRQSIKIENIPQFDGYNISIEMFIAHCKAAKQTNIFHTRRSKPIKFTNIKHTIK